MQAWARVLARKGVRAEWGRKPPTEMRKGASLETPLTPDSLPLTDQTSSIFTPRLASSAM